MYKRQVIEGFYGLENYSLGLRVDFHPSPVCRSPVIPSFGIQEQPGGVAVDHALQVQQQYDIRIIFTYLVSLGHLFLEFQPGADCFTRVFYNGDPAAAIIIDLCLLCLLYTSVFADLTDREREVLKLVASAKTNKEIAEELFISEKTVKNHISNILFKLQANDRTEAALYAAKHGLIE